MYYKISYLCLYCRKIPGSDGLSLSANNFCFHDVIYEGEIECSTFECTADEYSFEYSPLPFFSKDDHFMNACDCIMKSISSIGIMI